MKKLIASVSLIFVFSLLISCGGKCSYYDQLSNDKSFTTRILDLNKTIGEIRTSEKGQLIKEDITLLEYVYEVGESDSYVITYLFDEKGCYEIGVDAYFGKEDDAKNVVDGIKTEMNTSEYGAPKEDNFLCRWKNNNESISVELDYSKTKRGEFIATIFANE